MTEIAHTHATSALEALVNYRYNSVAPSCDPVATKAQHGLARTLVV